MTITRRGEVALLTIVALLAFAAGVTATAWDPYARAVDNAAQVSR